MSETIRSGIDGIESRTKRGVLKAISTIALFAAAIGVAEVTNTNNISKGQNCTGLEFVVSRGNFGTAEMYVFPVFNSGIGAVSTGYMNGVVESGNNAGEHISNSLVESYGEFAFNWSPASSVTQTSTVKVITKINGTEFSCPSTTLHFDPKTYNVSPSVPK